MPIAVQYSKISNDFGGGGMRQDQDSQNWFNPQDYIYVKTFGNCFFLNINTCMLGPMQSMLSR